MSILYNDCMDEVMRQELERASMFANLLDNQFNLFGVRFGLTMLLDIIPEIGDIVAFLLSLYFIRLAISLKVPKLLIARMFFNIGINLFLGLIPVIGEATYILRKANLQNMSLLKSYIQKTYPTLS